MANIFEIAVENFDKVNKLFSLDLSECNRFWRGKCPLHDGDNPNSLVIYKNGHSTTGCWKCYTQGCHEKYGKSIIALIQGLLAQKYNREYNFGQAVHWCEDLFKIKAEQLAEKTLDDNLTQLSKKLEYKPTSSFKITEQQFLNKLERPVHYFLKRNFKEETLDYFKLGYCSNPAKPMYKRVIVPHYNLDGKFVIGCLGRIIYEKCNACGNYHDENSICRVSPKWRNSSDFPSTTSLYNYHRVAKNIKQEKIAILTEGTANVWRMYEAGINIALSCFGTNFSTVQKELLDSLGVETIIIVPDADEAGTNLVNNIKEQCKYTHNIVTVEPTYKTDIGDANIETVKKVIGPYLDKLK